MARQLTFTFMEKEYILEFNRKTTLETGVSIAELQGIADDPMLALKLIPTIWSKAFEMHHSDCPEETKEMIYEAFADKEELVGALTELYLYPLEALFGNAPKGKNLKWKKNWK